MVGIDIRVGNTVLYGGCELNGKIDLRGIFSTGKLYEMLKLRLIAELIISLRTGAAEKCLVTLINESGKSGEKGVYEFVLVRKNRLVVEYVEQL